MRLHEVLLEFPEVRSCCTASSRDRTSPVPASHIIDPLTITDGADVNDRSAPIQGRKIASRMIPRPHQVEALRAIRETADSRALVVMAVERASPL